MAERNGRPYRLLLVIASANTLQRRQPRPAAGGFRLVNAITQMDVSPTGGGSLAPYPPDHHPSTVWHMSPADA
jgi:hexosaminidase